MRRALNRLAIVKAIAAWDRAEDSDAELIAGDAMQVLLRAVVDVPPFERCTTCHGVGGGEDPTSGTEWACIVCNGSGRQPHLAGVVDGVCYCYGGCGTRYQDFAKDVSLPTPLWNRIAVGPPFDETQEHIEREGRGGVLCPACIVARLAALPECTVIRMDIDLVPTPAPLRETIICVAPTSLHGECPMMFHGCGKYSDRCHYAKEEPLREMAQVTQWRSMSLYLRGLSENTAADLMEAAADQLQEAEQRLATVTEENAKLRGARRIHELDNHHNAAACPYCNPDLEKTAARLQQLTEELTACRRGRVGDAERWGAENAARVKAEAELMEMRKHHPEADCYASYPRLRAQLRQLTKERDEARADAHLLKRAIAPDRAGHVPWDGMPDVTYFVGTVLKLREGHDDAPPTSLGRALRLLAHKSRLSSLDVPVLEEAAAYVDRHAQRVAMFQSDLSEQMDEWLRAVKETAAVHQAGEACRQQLEQAEGQLRALASLVARRPALDKPTLYENVEHAIRVAGQKTDECLRLEVELEALRKKREGCVEGSIG